MATSHLCRHDPSEVLTQRNGEVPVPCEKIQSRLNNLRSSMRYDLTLPAIHVQYTTGVKDCISPQYSSCEFSRKRWRECDLSQV